MATKELVHCANCASYKFCHEAPISKEMGRSLCAQCTLPQKGATTETISVVGHSRGISRLKAVRMVGAGLGRWVDPTTVTIYGPVELQRVQEGRRREQPFLNLNPAVLDLKPHDHAALIYDDRREWQETAVAFIAGGIKAGHKCLYITARSRSEYLRKLLYSSGVDAGEAERSGQIVFLPADYIYIGASGFRSGRTVGILAGEVKAALAQGCQAVRLTVEMEWFLRHRADMRELEKYEAGLHQHLLSRYPCVALCQYDSRLFDAVLLKQVSAVHPLIARHRGVFKNHSHIDPDKLLGDERDKHELLAWLDNLKEQHTAAERIKLLSEAIDGSPMAFIAVYPDGRIITCNLAFCHLLGYSPEELRNETWDIDLPPPEWDTFQRGVLEPMALTGQPQSLEKVYVRKDGTHIPVELLVCPVVDGQGRLLYYHCFVRDLTARNQALTRLQHVATHDQLTGLYNRLHFEEMLASLDGSDAYPVAVFALDIDGLKLINSTFGTAAGDEYLRACARVLPEVFPPQSVIARTGGDEFGVIVSALGPDRAELLACRLDQALESADRSLPGNVPLSTACGWAIAHSKDTALAEAFTTANRNLQRDQLSHATSAVHQIVNVLVAALSEKDNECGAHLSRLVELSRRVGESIGLSKRELGELVLLAEMHDLGKVGIPDRILTKAGPLDDDEWDSMRQHSVIGYRIAQASPELAPVAGLILHHHEWWNGQGYPVGLAGTDIPVACRVLAIVDAYDAMTTDRPYRRALTHEEALARIRRGAGTQFDPELVERFVSTVGDMRSPKASAACELGADTASTAPG